MVNRRRPGAAASRSSLEDVIVTDELRRRDSRPPDHEAESRALSSLVREMAAPDADVLQTLVERALEMCGAHSAGVCRLEREGDGETLHRHAVAGRWVRFLDGAAPRDAGPCRAALDRDETVLMSGPERGFLYDVADGPPVVEALLVPFRIEDEPVGTIRVVAHDETRRFDAEDERLLTSLAGCASTYCQLTSARETGERSSRAEDRFLSAMSHELREPLNAIQGYADLLHDGVLGAVTEKQREVLRRTRKTASQLIGLIDDVLVFAGADDEDGELQLVEVDVADLVRDVTGTYAARANQKEIALEVVGADEPVHATSDEDRLRQIVSNLVDNAVKYTRTGRVSVELHAGEDELEIRVRDTGPGIPPDRIDDVFEPFERVDASGDEDSPGGTGLGLAIARRMARALDGDVTADSTPGEGSVFTLRLPR